MIRKEYRDFIQYALDERKTLPANLDDASWQDFFQFCYRHGIAGVVFAGIEHADRPIPQDVLLDWLSIVESTKIQNRLVNKRIHNVIKWFEEKGYRSVILKGQANGLMFPHPELRTPGDIDIWVEGSRTEIIRTILGVAPDARYSIHHIKLPVFKDVSVEVHYRPIYLIDWITDKRLQKHVELIEKQQFEHKELLDDAEMGCLTNDFNVVYQLMHMYVHFFSTRNNFKQFIDYYYLLKRGLSDRQKKEVVVLMKELKVLKYARGIMWVMKEVLGLDDSLLIVGPDEKVGKTILRESMYYGLFSTNKFRYVIERFVANFRLVLMFPGQVLISPLFLAWHQWWKLKMKLELKGTFV